MKLTKLPHKTNLLELSPYNIFDKYFGFDEILDRFASFSTSNSSLRCYGWKENGENYTFEIELPGVKKENIELQTNSNTITVNYKNERKNESEQLTSSYPVPSHTDINKIKAKYSDGLLTITIPKLEIIKTKTITIE